jgi:hypothetical protein
MTVYNRISLGLLEFGAQDLVSMSGRPRNKIDFNTVREIARELPDVEEGTMHGSPSLKVRGKLLTCIPVNKQAEPDSLAVRIDFDQRTALLAEAPDVYYITDHYVPYPMVLVRMSRINRDALRDLLRTGWRFVTARKGNASKL